MTLATEYSFFNVLFMVLLRRDSKALDLGLLSSWMCEDYVSCVFIDSNALLL